jgi:uncharacterized phosphosugar-binding protein
MIKERFFQQLKELILRIEHEQSSNMDAAADAITEAIANGNCIHIYDTGHMLDSELINRAGGMSNFKPLRVKFEIENPVRNRPEDATKDRNIEGFIKYALRTSNLQPGDVLIVGSVSGKSVFPVDITLAAKEMGAYVIAMTSVAFSTLLKSDHSTGKRLFEVADLVIDNCAPPLDAMVRIPELDLSMCPASGISAATIMWAIEAKVTENLLARGIKPTILKSINFPGSGAYNEKEYLRYEETGH